MNREERAKQFMPFAALKGYPEALRKMENIIVPKAELSEEYQDELNRSLLQVRINDIISVTYFHKNEYLKVTGMVSRIDKYARLLQVVNTKIAFNDIYHISGENIQQYE